MKRVSLSLLLVLGLSAYGTPSSQQEETEKNKEIALNFYRDLWGSPNTDRYSQYVAETYVVHDIGDRKGVTEPAIEQKEIADFFWKHGEMEFELDYQVASEDRVATRWIGHYTPRSLFGKIFLGKHSIPVINVFRIKNGKIVEIWNHRHDIDTTQTLRFTIKGVIIGIVLVLIPFGLVYMKRKQRKNEE